MEHIDKDRLLDTARAALTGLLVENGYLHDHPAVAAELAVNQAEALEAELRRRFELSPGPVETKG